MDQLDRAQQEHDLHLSLQLKHRNPTLPVTGRCHWCLSSLEADLKFCDSDCLADYSKNKKIRG